jgi:hypothetical protein
MKLLLLLCLVMGGTHLRAKETDPVRKLLRSSLVRLTIHGQSPSYYSPWKWANPKKRSGQGLVVGENLVLTLSSLVRNSTQIEVRLNAEPTPRILKVLHADLDRGLALLQGELPPGVEVIELPKVSNIKLGDKARSYWKTDRGRFMEGHATLDHVDAVIADGSYQCLLWYEGSNASVQGGYGEPVFCEGNLIGISVKNGQGSEMSVLPVEEIHRRYEFPSGRMKPDSAMAGFVFNPCTQKNFRDYNQLKDEDGGCVVTSILGQGSGAEELKVGDIILEFDGRKLDAWGRYEHPKFGSLSFEHLFSEKKLGDSVEVTLVREGERKTLSIRMASISEDRWLLPEYRGGQPGRFFIRGGYVFQNLSLPYLMAWGRDWTTKAPDDLLVLFNDEKGLLKQPEREEVVMLGQVLAHASNRGLQHLGRKVIDTINNEPLRGLKHLKEVLDDPKQKRVLLGLRPGNVPLLLDASEMRKVDKEIEESYGIDTMERL